MKKIAALMGLTLAATVALAGCGGSSGSSGKGTTDLGTVEMTDNKFSKSEFSGPAGEFKIKLVNKGATTHDFTINGTNVKFTVAPGKEETKTFKIDKPGDYELICSQPGHKESGMKGTFKVTQ